MASNVQVSAVNIPLTVNVCVDVKCTVFPALIVKLTNVVAPDTVDVPLKITAYDPDSVPAVFVQLPVNVKFDPSVIFAPIVMLYQLIPLVLRVAAPDITRVLVPAVTVPVV